MFHRLRCREKLAESVTNLNLPVPRARLLRIPNSSWTRWGQSVVRAIAYALRLRSKLFAQLFYSTCRVVPMGAITLKRHCMNVISWAKTFSAVALSDFTVDEYNRAMSGIDFVRLQVNSRWPVEVPMPNQIDIAYQELDKLLASFRGLGVCSRSCYEALAPPPPHKLPSDFDRSVGRMASALVSSAGRILVLPEDKDPNTLWLCCPRLMAIRWLAQFKRFPETWETIDSVREGVIRIHRLVNDRIILRPLRDAFTPISSRHIPCVYPTVKRKCWTPVHEMRVGNSISCAHVCTKATHSCIRNVCSFFHMQSRGTWQACARALRFLVDSVFYSNWEFGGLDSAPGILRKSLSSICSPSLGRSCSVYNCSLKFPGLLVVDAGQAFEALKPSAIQAACDALFAGARRIAPSGTISIAKSKKMEVVAGGSISVKYRDRYVFTLETLYKILQAYLLLSYYCNGDISFYQLTSIPIGGPLSSLVLDMTLGYHEHISAASHGGNRTEIACHRFADDIILASRRRYRACLKTFVFTVFNTEITFDPDDAYVQLGGYVIQSYLDMLSVRDG